MWILKTTHENQSWSQLTNFQRTEIPSKLRDFGVSTEFGHSEIDFLYGDRG